MPANGNPRWLLPTVLVAGLAIIAGGWWIAERRAAQVRETTAIAARMHAIVDEFQKGLPRQYAPGLVLDRVAFEGSNLVMTIRSTNRKASQAGPDLVQVAQAEKALMLPLCEQPDVLFLLARDVTITRRFVDNDGAEFFEITLVSADCAR